MGQYDGSVFLHNRLYIDLGEITLFLFYNTNYTSLSISDIGIKYRN
jgi:hypothetical protein